MISLYTLQRFAHFSPQDSISSVGFFALHGVWETDDRDIVFQKRLHLTMDRPYHLLPLHLLVYHCKSWHNLINYARAHNSLWLHTEVSSMNNLMIPLSLGGGPYTNRQHWVLQVPQSTQMWVLVATLSWTIIKHLTSVMNISQTQSTSTSIACPNNKRRSNSQWFECNAGNRYYLNLLPNPTS